MGFRRRAAALAGAVVTTVACGGGEVPGVVVNARPPPRIDRVEALAKGSCVVVYMADCPPEGACDAQTYGRESVPCPEGLNVGGSMELLHGAGQCHVAWNVTCDPDSTCNPPEPIPFDCPAKYRTAPPPPPPRIVRRPDGTCEERSSPRCPPDVACNPPPPRPVPCPPEVE